MSEKLTTKQRLFVEAYLANPNGVQAAREAGYKGNDAQLAVIASQNLRKLNIAEKVEERISEAIITADEILRDVKAIAKDPNEKASDRLKGYELMGKHLAMWIENSKAEVTIKKIEVEFI